MSFEEQSTSELVDQIGMIVAQRADLDTLRKKIAHELLARAGNQKILEGVLFSVTIIASTIVATVDTKKMEAELGEAFLRRFLKTSVREAYLKPSARKGVAA